MVMEKRAADPNDNEHIYPTGKCFDDALVLLVELLAEHPEAEPDLRLVHGVLAEPEEHSHAWVEDVSTATVLFTGIYKGIRRHFQASMAEYYVEMAVRETYRYTYSQAYAETCGQAISALGSRACYRSAGTGNKSAM
jgi:hypothetical protein